MPARRSASSSPRRKRRRSPSAGSSENHATERSSQAPAHALSSAVLPAPAGAATSVTALSAPRSSWLSNRGRSTIAAGTRGAMNFVLASSIGSGGNRAGLLGLAPGPCPGRPADTRSGLNTPLAPGRARSGGWSAVRRQRAGAQGSGTALRHDQPLFGATIDSGAVRNGPRGHGPDSRFRAGASASPVSGDEPDCRSVRGHGRVRRRGLTARRRLGRQRAGVELHHLAVEEGGADGAGDRARGCTSTSPSSGRR